MQQDMHFYGVYALARAAGIKDAAAETIAYASQFVDDAIDQGIVLVTDKDSVLPTMTSHKPIDYQNAIPNDQWHVWVPFHFLPGNEGKDFYSRMRCATGSKKGSAAMRMLDASLDTGCRDLWPHLIGITSHVFADTFSHHGFIGLCCDNNKVDADSISPSSSHSAGIINYIKAKWDEFITRFTGDAAEIIPVGHGPVGTYPDRPYLKWQFKYENGGAPVYRDNPPEYLQACRLLHGYFMRYRNADNNIAAPEGPKTWVDISVVIRKILAAEEPMDGRIDAWKKATAGGKFCNVTDKDKGISYNEGLWRPRRAAISGGSLQDSDICRFILAAHRHRDYVLRELLPKLGVITV